MTSPQDISQMFDTESEKLQNLLGVAEKKSDLSIHEIVETYYQVMNVSTMITMLKTHATENNSLLDKIQKIEKFISGTFNSEIHPKITQQLVSSIQETTKNLQSVNSNEQSKEKIESDAKLFEELRQKMSTKEFVEQYDKGLSND
ncbi:hypothetical protein [Nitrosopumilus adriaticus]|uniref:Uncharacterized protein n=1 Tax=Nitrosopumilus adriaticus TaxID=1580092 RepID=A0A0D5C3D4_9ARCH|nr:hypothetical protein [Nitrosopumilus adriaticus]AJW71299.1 hypothetical protein NADRNF5_1618 [Nitrosopumilus adriaticus]